MSASLSMSPATTTPDHSVTASPFDFFIVPRAPRGAIRCGPFVVLGGLVMYATILVTALTGSTTTGPTFKPAAVLGHSVPYMTANANASVG